MCWGLWGAAGQVPAPVAEQGHGRGEEDAADDGGVQQDGGGQTGAEHLQFGQLQLLISNDGSDGSGSAPLATADRSGNGLRNLAAHLEAVGGQLTAAREDGTFSLSVELPLVESQPLV